MMISPIAKANVRAAVVAARTLHVPDTLACCSDVSSAARGCSARRVERGLDLVLHLVQAIVRLNLTGDGLTE